MTLTQLCVLLETNSGLPNFSEFKKSSISKLVYPEQFCINMRLCMHVQQCIYIPKVF